MAAWETTVNSKLFVKSAHFRVLICLILFELKRELISRRPRA